MEHPEHIWFLMSRSLSGEASSAEQAELSALLAAQPSLQQQYEVLQQLWSADNEQPRPEPAKIGRILQLSAVEEAARDKRKSTAKVIHWKKVFRYAAILIVLVGAVWAVDEKVFRSGNENDGVLVAKKGTKTRAILPDGSTVVLNAGSRIEYDPAFNGITREVTLYGEAYFDVVKQTNRPFIVHAGGINIKVLGTAFNVKSYPGDQSVETTLIRGLVQIIRPGRQQEPPIFLHPNQKIVLPVGNENVEKTNEATVTEKVLPAVPVSTVSYLDSTLKENEHIETAWVYNRLQFRGDNFDELSKKLERWYNITIHFEDEAAKSLTFNGSIENETVEQAFEALRTAVAFNYKIRDNEVYVSSY
jgi:transmembrane sensor